MWWEQVETFTMAMCRSPGELKRSISRQDHPVYRQTRLPPTRFSEHRPAFGELPSISKTRLILHPTNPMLPVATPKSECPGYGAVAVTLKADPSPRAGTTRKKLTGNERHEQRRSPVQRCLTPALPRPCSAREYYFSPNDPRLVRSQPLSVIIAPSPPHDAASVNELQPWKQNHQQGIAPGDETPTPLAGIVRKAPKTPPQPSAPSTVDTSSLERPGRARASPHAPSSACVPLGRKAGESLLQHLPSTKDSCRRARYRGSTKRRPTPRTPAPVASTTGGDGRDSGAMHPRRQPPGQ